ncbi:MAG: shikimate kinase AroK [Pseudomonadota bacterium]
MNVYLIGPMGAGKSAVGKQLARLLKLEFIDSDSEIERRTGVDIPFIFEKEGEAGFRKRESAVIADLTERNNLVLATGGGVIGDPENRRRLGSRGQVVYLTASIEQQLTRTSRGRERPLLKDGEPRDVLTRLMEVREPLYTELADMVVETDKRRVNDVADEIVARLEAL